MKTRKDLVDEWNDLHIKYTKFGPIGRNGRMIEFCEKYILEAKEAYYNTESPIMEDEAFDMLESSLKTLRPNSKVLEKVGG
jgi:hypothetical protein